MPFRGAYLAHICNQINQISDQIKNWLGNQSMSILDYDNITLSRRLTQKIVDIIYSPILKSVSRDPTIRPDTFPTTKLLMNFDGVVINTASGHTSVSTIQVIKHICKFVAYWSFLFLKISISIFNRGGERGLGATLLYGVGYESIVVDGSDKRFVEYCFKGPIRPLNNTNRLIIQSLTPVKSSFPDQVRYERFPEIDLIKMLHIGWGEGLILLFRHIQLFFVFMSKIITNPLFVLLGRDIAYEVLIRWLNDRGEIKDIIITNSNYQQFLWMSDMPERKYALHQLWYSVNSKPLVYKSAPLDAIIPGLYLNVSDEIWVWTESQKMYLEKFMTGSKFHVVGPILWYLNSTSVRPERELIRIALFDVTPVKDEWASDYGIIYNYYSSENMERFIKSTIDVVRKKFQGREMDVEILLKQKRSSHSIHDDSYASLIERLLDEVSFFKIMPPSSNMFELLSDCDMAIVVPYSSPAQVAKSLGVPAVYYDSSESLKFNDEGEGIIFASGQNELMTTLSNHF